jgi:hypothetical protein
VKAAGALYVAIAMSAAGCASRPTLATAVASLPDGERQALLRIVDRAGASRDALIVQTDLYEFAWRGAAAHASLHGRADLVGAIARATRDTRNSVVIEGGHVRALRLAGTRLDDLGLVSPLRHAVVLDFHDARIQRIEGLEAMNELDHLDLSGNRPGDLRGLEGLKALRSLYLADARLERIEGLEGLVSLEVLNLSGNDIHRIEGLGNLHSLRALSIERNPIDRLEGLGGLDALTDLDLSFCPVERIERLEELPELRFLNLWHTHVRSLVGLDQAKALVYVGLGENGTTYPDPASEAIKRTFCKKRLCEFW